MSEIQRLWEQIKRIFEPLVNKRADYPWEQCIKDQTEKYGSKEKAEKVCGMIKAKYARSGSDVMQLPDDFDLAKELRDIDSVFAVVENAAHEYHTDKMEACLKHLKDQGADPEKAHKICYAALGEDANRSILETQTRSFSVTRDASGNARWLMIAASAVVNKVGAIDSTSLFDSFIRQAQQEGYPVLDFLHQGKRVSFGVADWLARDGALYLASGTFDDTDLARAATAGLEKDPSYWGASISYRATEPPLVMEAEGRIPVYTAGVNDFISIVPKRMAANLFTATSVTKEVSRTMDAKVYEELVKLVGEERAKMFAGDVDDANRTITETGMVTRADTTPPEATAQVAETPSVLTPATPVETRQAEPVPPKEPDTPTVSLDDLAKKIAELSARVTEIEQKLGGAMGEAERAQKAEQEIIKRVANVEASKERWDAWLNDAPEQIRQEADQIYRARTQETNLPTYAQIAQATTSKMNNGPHHKRQGG